MPIWDRRKAIRVAHEERRRNAALFDKYSDLIASPSDLGSVAAGGDLNPLDLPASAIIGVSFSVDVSAGQLTVDTNTGRVISTPALVADEIHRLGWLERGVDLTVSCAIAGTVSVHVLDNWMRPSEIATGVFT